MIKRMASAQQHQNRSLEALRGFAALLVVASHARLYLYTEAGLPLSGTSPVEKILLIPTSFGREAVAVFFVLSGYLVGGQVVRQVKSSRFSPREYLVKRMSRFWVVLIPGLAITVLVDAASRSLFTTNEPVVQGRDRSSLQDLACNAVFLMDGRCEPFGSNVSLWSLGYEFWFYIVFAGAVVAAYALLRRQYLRASLGALVALIVIAAYGAHLLWLIPAWLLGVAVAEVAPHARSRLTSTQATMIGALVLAVLGLAASAVLKLHTPVKYAMLGLTTAPLVLVLAIADPQARRGIQTFERFGVWLGKWSFTLYVFHLPFVMIATAAWTHYDLPVNVAACYLLFIAVVAVTYPTFWLGEAHTPRVRQWLLRATARRGLPDDVEVERKRATGCVHTRHRE